MVCMSSTFLPYLLPLKREKAYWLLPIQQDDLTDLSCAVQQYSYWQPQKTFTKSQGEVSGFCYDNDILKSVKRYPEHKKSLIN